MSKSSINPNKIVVFTGAGVSAESGLKTFRDSDGLWENYPVDIVASPRGWELDPLLVLQFYNQRRDEAASALSNTAHFAIAELEQKYEVVVITQNIDSLHEQAGSSHVIHLHGELCKARSSIEPDLIYDVGNKPIHLGQKCELNSQLRPHVVWFGEFPLFLDEAKLHLREAAFVLVVGTSLTVEPAASLLKNARYNAIKVITTLDIDKVPYGFTLLRGKATEMVPFVCREWLRDKK